MQNVQNYCVLQKREKLGKTEKKERKYTHFECECYKFKIKVSIKTIRQSKKAFF